MKYTIDSREISDISRILNQRVSRNEIRKILDIINNSQSIFPLLDQKVLLVKLFSRYFNNRKTGIILMEESSERVPVTVTLGVLGEDWVGMSNSLLGIIHHEDINVDFVKGCSIQYGRRELALMLLAFKIQDEDRFRNFQKERKNLKNKIKAASRGNLSKTKLLDNEVIKLEIYNSIIRHIRRSSLSPDEKQELCGQNGEALKYVVSRSREYLEERRIKELVYLILLNFKLTRKVRKESGVHIKVKNFSTVREKLTGITLVCPQNIVSIEEFLETMEFIVPHYRIKHHKSFVTNDKVLIYRLEITDRYENPLKKELIRSIEATLKRLVLGFHNKGFSRLKSIGGFEHFARAVIPFLIEEYRKTGLNQVFINIEKKTAFFLDIRLIIVSEVKNPRRHRRFLNRLLSTSGFDINMMMPPKVYQEDVEVSVQKIRVDFSVFLYLKDIYDGLNRVIEAYYGKIRDFDKGFREIDLARLKQLNEELPGVSELLVSEVFFSFDELVRIEKPVGLLKKVIRLCNEIIDVSNRKTDSGCTVLKYGFMTGSSQLVMVVSCIEGKHGKILNKMLNQLSGLKMYFSKIEWNQRVYLMLILAGDPQPVARKVLERITEDIRIMVC